MGAGGALRLRGPTKQIRENRRQSKGLTVGLDLLHMAPLLLTPRTMVMFIHMWPHLLAILQLTMVTLRMDIRLLAIRHLDMRHLDIHHLAIRHLHIAIHHL